MNRRSFLGTILALGVAPAIVRVDSLMRVVPVDTTILGVDTLYGIGYGITKEELKEVYSWYVGDIVTINSLGHFDKASHQDLNRPFGDPGLGVVTGFNPDKSSIVLTDPSIAFEVGK